MIDTKKVRIGNRLIGEGEPCYIIAEAGSNHNGDLKIAKELIDAASDSGVDAIKFQIFSASNHYSRKTPAHSDYKEHLYDLIKRLEIPREWIADLKSYSDKKGITFFASPCDYDAVEQLEEIGALLYKISSFEIVDLCLIEYIASKQKPLIISTGLANLEEIHDAYQACMKVNNNDIILLQCASSYPSKPEIMNLKSMETISRAFNVITGLSDHTQGIHIPIAAVAMGAKVIEKHFTLNRKMDGPDHAFAIEPNDLEMLIRQIREVELSIGNGMKLGPSSEEKEYYEKARRSIHAAHNISKGSSITSDMLIMKRPGYGIKPKFVNLIIGRETKVDIEEDQWISWDMI